MRICRQITGKQLKPVRVRLTHYRATRTRCNSRSSIGCEVEYGATRDEILFAREDGELRVVNADPYLNRLLVEVCEETLSRQRRAAGVVRGARGECSRAAVAAWQGARRATLPPSSA